LSSESEIAATPVSGKRSDAALTYMVRHSYDEQTAFEQEEAEEEEQEGGGEGDDEGGDTITPSFKAVPVQTWQAAKPQALPPAAYNDFDVAADGSDFDLRVCPDCDRKFRPEALARHIGICKKVFIQKRKVFDSKKMRLTGEEDAEVRRKSSSLGTATTRQAGASKWKQDSIAFREAMRGAREYEAAVDAGMPPPMRESIADPTYVQCPTCTRRFSQTAGERHIPLCKNIKAKPTALKRSSLM